MTSTTSTLFGEVETPPAPRGPVPARPQVEGPFAGVALEQGIDRSLDYAIPARLAASIHVGQRVKVPLGKKNRPTFGYVVSIHPTSDYPRIKHLLDIDDARILVPPKLMDLARWMSRYYVTPLGTVLESVIPSAVKRKVGIGYQQIVRLVPTREATQETLEKTSAPKRRAILARLLLLEPGETIELMRLASESGVTAPTVRKLVRLGMITITPEVDLPRLTADIVPSAGNEAYIALNEDQQKVFDAILPRLVGEDAARKVVPSQTSQTPGLERDDLSDASSIAALVAQRDPARAVVATSKGAEGIDGTGAPTETRLSQPPRNGGDLPDAGVARPVVAAGGTVAPGISDPAGFSVNLLLGVTGSGKTEVYLQCIREVVNRGRQAIVLVPEIALTPQTVRRFTARFKSVAILHSGLTATERHRYWQMIATGHAQVVVGARSAIFAPLPKLGIIVVDEEHEASYKQDSAPRYHGRDIAIKRGQVENVPVLLGSATPSLETYWRVMEEERRGAEAGQTARRHEGKEARRGDEEMPPIALVSSNEQPPPPAGPYSITQAIASPNSIPSSVRSVPPCLRASVPASRYHLLPLPRRVRGLQMPHVELVDMKQENKFRRGVHLIGQRLEHLLRTTVESGQQAILLLNRRGYSNFVHCASCQEVIQCKYCDATMTYHRSAGPHELSASHAASQHTGQLHCHYCLAVNALPTKCPTCSKQLSLFGLGTQRVEEEMAKKFPELKYARVDGDSMRGGKDYEALLARFAKGEVQVMLGTQMIAKGLDYPNVTLVGVISGDTALALPDFRAAERTFQLITQVAGRAGRGDKPGRVVLQTFLPDDPTIQAAIRQDFTGFAASELITRKEVGLPPFARLVRVVLRDQDQQKLHKMSEELAAKLTEAAEAEGGRIQMKGPMPCAISRIAGYHRYQIVMLSATPGPLQRVLAKVREKGSLAKSDKIAVDVDPVSLL